MIEHYIYTLSDPISGDIRYVGQTNNIKIRYKKHISNTKRKTKVINWIKSLKNKNLKPIIEIIDIVDYNNRNFWEEYWIWQMKVWGFNLMNLTYGGDHNGNHSEETKKKISNIQIGRKNNDEWKQNISKGRIGMKFSDEHRKNISKSIKSLSHNGQLLCNKKSIYQIDINSGEILNKFVSITEAYKYLNITAKSGLISTVCNGKIKSAYGYYWCYCDK